MKRLMADPLVCPKCRIRRAADAKHCPACGSPLLRDEAVTAVTRVVAGPKTLGRYRLIERLGSGGMGVVWKALDPDLNRPVALKLLHADLPDDIKHLQREAKIAARLRHANVAAVHDVGIADGQAYIAMEFIDGRSAGDLTMPVRRAAEVVRDAARAVHYAHGQGVIHRDLKPGNLMVDHEGRVVVMDFGLAKELRSDSSLSATGAIMGTPSYMSPEQAKGRSKHADARSDVWGLGATLYALLTGRPPFEGDSPYQVAAMVVEKEPPRPRRLNPRLPTDLETIILKCLEKEPARRYATADDLARDLTRFLEGEAIRARPASTFYRLGKALSKRKALATASLVALLAIGGVGALLAARGIASRTNRERRESLLSEANRLFDRGDFASARAKYEQAKGLKAQIPQDRYLRCVEEERLTLRRSRRNTELGPYLERCETALRAAASARGSRQPVSGVWRERIADAIRAIDEALALDPDWAALYVARGRAKVEGDDLDGAIADFSKAIELAPRGTPARYERGRTYLELMARRTSVALVGSPSSQADLLALRRKAEEDFRAGSEDGWALPEGELPLLRLYVLYATGRIADVIPAARELAESRSYDGRIWQILGEAQLVTGDFSGASKSLDKALWEGNRRAVVYFLRGMAMGKTGDLRRAITDLTRAIDLDPKFAAAWSNRGMAWLWYGDAKKGLEDLDRAVMMDERSASAWHGRAVARGMLGDWSGQVEDCSQAIELDPGNANVFRDRAAARQRTGDWPGSLQDADRAIELAPGDAQAYATRGASRRALGNPKGCIADCEQAIDLDPKLSWAYYVRGAARNDLGDPKGMEEDCTRAIELEPGFASAYYNRALARMLLSGKKSGPERVELLNGAISDCETYLRSAPNDPKAAEVRRWIEECRRRLTARSP